MTREKSIEVVVDVESDDPIPIGVYERTDEDVIVYRDAAGMVRNAPADCVIVLPLDVPLP